MSGEPFEWSTVPNTTIPALRYRLVEIARLQQRVDNGVWLASLRHPDGRTQTRACSSFEAGRAGCEAWAERHRAALTSKIDADWADARRSVHGVPHRPATSLHGQ